MNFESPDDPDMNEQWQPGDGGSDDLSFGEHDPTGGILPPDEAPASPDLVDVPASSHGIARFEGMEPQFDNRPPEDYLEATYWRLDDVIQHGYHTKYTRLFADSERSEYVTEEQHGSSKEETVVRRITALEYHTPEGLAEIQLSYRELKVRFKDHDGNTLSYCRYYTDHYSYGEGEEPYDVIRKDTVDLEAEGFVATEGLSRSDANILRNEADYQHRKAIHDRKQQGIENPLVGVEEAEYMFGEVLANARPVAKTHEDVITAIEGERMRQAAETVDERAVLSGRVLYDKLLPAYRENVITPEEDVTWDRKTVRELASADGSLTVTNTTGVIPENLVTGRAVTYTVITIVEKLDNPGLTRRLTENGMAATVRQGGTFTTNIRLTSDGSNCAGDVSTSVYVKGYGDFLRDPHMFHPTEEVMQTVRNYLWADVEKVQTGNE